jgi:hypothetical protein
MTDPPTAPRTAYAETAGRCAIADCDLPAAPNRSLCGLCADVYTATFALYHALVTRDGARIEAETPGFLEAMRRWLFASARTKAGDPPAAVSWDLGVRERLRDGVVIDWQVERLERHVAELRALAIDSRVSP